MLKTVMSGLPEKTDKRYFTVREMKWMCVCVCVCVCVEVCVEVCVNVCVLICERGIGELFLYWPSLLNGHLGLSHIGRVVVILFPTKAKGAEILKKM